MLVFGDPMLSFNLHLSGFAEEWRLVTPFLAIQHGVLLWGRSRRCREPGVMRWARSIPPWYT